MAGILKDLRYGARQLLRTPMVSGIAVLTFALGIGLTLTVFSIVNGAMFKGLPFEDADRIVALSRTNPEREIERGGVPVHDYLDWSAQQSTFEEIGLSGGGTVNLTGSEGRPERYVGAFVTANLFDLLRVRPELGRGFVEGEDRPGAEKVIVLGYEVWQEKFDGSPDVLGKTVRANGEPRTVVGVAPEGFEFPTNNQLWLPMELDPLGSTRGESPTFLAYGRLAPGVSEDEAAADLATIAARLAAEYPESNEGWGVRVDPYTSVFLGDQVHALLLTMLGAVIGVLLIACANVANLLFARASTRGREMAIRSALGAGRGRVIRQMLTEVSVLAAVGALLGVGVGYAGLAWFEAAIASDPPPFWITFEPDVRVILFLVGVTVFAGLAAGLVPAVRATGGHMNEALKDEGRGSSSLRTGRVTAALVVAEVAVSCGLLIAAGLMIRSVVQLNTVDLPFQTERVLTARLNLPGSEYPDTASRTGFYERLLPRLEAIPGVEAATLSDGLPASGNGTRVFEVEGESYPTERDYPFAREGIVTPGYFRTFEVDVLRGRAFTPQDRMGDVRVAVVNRSFVERFFPDGDPLGRRIRMGRQDTTASWLTIVGVVPDLKMEGISNTDGDPSGFYIPIAQSGVGNFVSIAVRTEGDPTGVVGGVREAVTSIDANLPIYDVMDMEAVIEGETWFYRVFGTLFMVFGFVALFLAAVGLYGVMSFSVAQRRKEMGIRMALGAWGGSLIRLAMRRGVWQLGLGLAIGLALALLATTPLQIVLYEVDARDPLIFGGVALALAATGLLATWLPAQRVTRIDPVSALAPE